MAQSSKRPGVFGSLVIVAVGVTFFVAGLFVHRSYSPYADGTSTTGTITDVRSGRGDDGKTMYTAVYTFTTADGREVSFEDPASSSNRPALGARVDVSYQPASPELARRIPGFDWFGWLVIAMGALVMVLGLLNLLRSVLRVVAVVATLALAWRNRHTTLP